MKKKPGMTLKDVTIFGEDSYGNRIDFTEVNGITLPKAQPITVTVEWTDAGIAWLSLLRLAHQIGWGWWLLRNRPVPHVN